MKVSINLVTWNGARFIRDCLESVFNQTFKDFELLIIDNGSTDDTVKIISDFYPHLKVVRHRENFGFAKGHNQAIHWSKSDYVLALNQDVIMQSDFLEKLVNFMDRHPLAGSITGKIYSLRDGQKTKYIDSLGLEIFKNHRIIEIGQGELDEGQYDYLKEVFGVSGALPLYRRKALQSVMLDQQFFDEDFFSYKEDVDLAYRLRYAGWKAFCVPEAIAYHHRSVKGAVKKISKLYIARNRRQRSKLINYWSYRNHFFMLIKNLPKFNLKYVWPVFWYEFLKFFYVLLREPKNLKVLSEVWRKRKQFQAKRKYIMDNRKIKINEIDKWLE